MNDLRQNLYYRIFGPALFGAALLLYLLTLSAGAFPSESAYYIAQMSGVEPRLTPDNTILTWIGSLLTVIGPQSSIVLRFNLFSAFCGAGAAWLMFQIMALFIGASVEVNSENRNKATSAALIAGVVSSLAMVCSLPFWTVSTRFHVATFHVLLFLAMCRLFITYLATRSRKLLLGFSFAYGICIVEYAPFIPFAFLFGPFILFWLWAFEEFEWKIVTQLVVTAVCGLLFYLIAAWSFYGSVIYGFMDDMNYFKVIWNIWRDQYFFLSAILPQSGWLIVIAIAIVPWFTAIFLARRGLNEDPNFSLWLLHLVLTVCAVAVLANVEFIREPITEAYRYLVLPYVLTASVFGYMAAYWYLLPMVISKDVENKALFWLRKWLGYIFVLPFVVLIIVFACLNFKSANGRVASFTNRYSECVVESMDDCHWLISNGSLDYNIMLKAHELGKDIKVVNIARSFNEPYLKYISSLTKQSITQNYIEVGVIPMLRAWMDADEDVYKDVAIFTEPDLWRALGYQTVPSKLVFKGVAADADINLVKLADDNNRFWSEKMPFIMGDSNHYGSLSYLYSNCKRHISLIANNTGVILEDGGMKDKAFAFYSKAREFDAGNVSSLLNQSLMIDHGFVSTQAGEIKSSLEKMAEERSKRMGIWSLSHQYGYVRHPEAFARQGMTWAMSGQPNMAVAGLKKAENLLSDKGKRAVQGMMAQVYLSSGQTTLGEDLYAELLKKNPDDMQAIMGMVEAALQNDELDTAREYLTRAEKVGVPAYMRDAQWASIAISAGDWDRARVIVESALQQAPEDLGLQVRLATILDQQHETQMLNKCLDRIERKDGGKFVAMAMRADIALRSRDIKQALSYFEKALTYQPNNIYVIEKLLRINFLIHNKSRTTEYVRRMLNIDANNYFAHYVIGVMRMSEKKYDLAEASYRKSLECQTSPEVLNDLAYLLFLSEKYEEAEKMVRSALELRQDFYIAWDTLGEICMKTGRMDEAEQSFQKALSLFQSDMRVHLHLAEILIAKGRKQEAGRILDMLFEKMNQLPLEDQGKVVELRKIVRS